MGISYSRLFALSSRLSSSTLGTSGRNWLKSRGSCVSSREVLSSSSGGSSGGSSDGSSVDEMLEIASLASWKELAPSISFADAKDSAM